MFSTFSGGVRPPENREATADKPFSNLPVPQFCHISLKQHKGNPAAPVVKPGDYVTEGQLIGAAQGAMSANVHASIPGRVSAVKDMHDADGPVHIVVIEAEGAFGSSGKAQSSADWSVMPREDIIARIRDAGIVGLGGEGVPAHEKLGNIEGKIIDTLLVNGAECEPYLTSDAMLLKTFPNEIIEGTRIVLKVLEITRAAICIGRNNPSAIKSIEAALGKAAGEDIIEVKAVPAKYPSGSEKQLVRSALGRVVPSGGTPADAGALVLNAGTIFFIRDAVISGKPMIERFITVSGSCIRNPGNYKVRIGAKVSDIIEECGGLNGDNAKIVMGGPMRGRVLTDIETPVGKNTSAILVLSKKESDIKKPAPCIRCGKCVEACPMGLVPRDIASAFEKGRFDMAADMNPEECILCGACSYICPAKRPLGHLVGAVQDRLKNNKPSPAA